jgi:hypothetical protein
MDRKSPNLIDQRWIRKLFAKASEEARQAGRIKENVTESRVPISLDSLKDLTIPRPADVFLQSGLACIQHKNLSCIQASMANIAILQTYDQVADIHEVWNKFNALFSGEAEMKQLLFSCALLTLQLIGFVLPQKHDSLSFKKHTLKRASFGVSLDV